MKFIELIKKVNIKYFNKIKYLKYYKTMKIDSNTILLEAQNANNYNGNIYYIAKELNENKEYQKYKIYFSINGKKYKKATKFFKEKEIRNIIFVKDKSKQYYKLLASAKYLITDTSFPPCLIKKEGQVIFNTWHGTPFKTLGKKVNNEFHDIGNIQKNFVVADYLLYPNEYMMKHMIEDYMLNNISDAKVILEGYPRNQVFFNKELQDDIRKEEKLEGKQIIAYMPTWRGAVAKIEHEAQQELTINYLKEIDNNLKENQILYVNLHPFISEMIDYSIFKNIKKFPKKYETYEFLSIADCLITDYSSVFYDFANTKKKIILFTYDEEEYLRDRGLYMSIDEFPFPRADNINALIREINTPKNYDDTEFLERFCKYDNLNSSKRLCEKVILNKDTVKTANIEKNGKDNILIYAGNLNANGITTALINLLKSVDLTAHNYFITFDSRKIARNKEVLRKLPEGVNYIASKGKMNLSLLGKIILKLYKAKLISDTKYINYMKNEFKDETKRLYGDIKFSTVIQFNGYEYKKIVLYSTFNCNKVIYAHNDMYKEATQKKNARLGILKYAYENYDKLALVTEDLIEPISKIADIKNKKHVANNLINYKHVLEEAEKEVKFDEQTECSVSQEQLLEILNSDSKKIINIGRFSKEKGQKRLIDAFQRAWKEDNSIYLIIIGGYGNEYESIISKASDMKCKEHIIIIKYVSNPFAILKKCDYFVLSSLYEGFGLVIAEADILGKPVISTDIDGPRIFMKKYKGKLVEDSEEGIYKGIKLLLKNEVKVMNVNYEKYNREAVEQFYKLLNV